MGIDPKQLRDMITRTLLNLNLHSEAAVNLLMGTAAQESHLGSYFRQLNQGPARGIFQMEPATEKDIWENFLEYRPVYAGSVFVVASAGSADVNALEFNLAYQIAMARIHYLRVPEKLPDAEDIEGMARYWKKYYNTFKGAGTEEEFIENYKRFVQGT